MTAASPETICLVQSRVGATPDGYDGPNTQQCIQAAGYSGTFEEIVASMFGVATTSLALDRYGNPNWPVLLGKLSCDAVYAVEGVRGSFVPAGVMIHHTAGPAGREQINTDILINGRPGIPGPLVQTGVSRNGDTAWITNGRAHHAGTGYEIALERVRLDSPPGKPMVDDVNGNSYFLGIEIDNSGKDDDPYPDIQIEAAVRVATGWCSAFGWTANRVIGHKEWTRRKVDPSYPMDEFRALVRTRLSEVDLAQLSLGL